MSTSNTVIQKPAVKLTYKEYVLFPADGKRHEIIDGCHYRNAAPNPRHQAISRHIQSGLAGDVGVLGGLTPTARRVADGRVKWRTVGVNPPRIRTLISRIRSV